MANKKIIIRILTITVIVALIMGSAFAILHHKNKKEEQQLEARFDRFMGYYYPYLQDIAKAAEVYKRMQISIMYDHLKYHKDRYIDDYISYYDGGSFSLREHHYNEQILSYATLLYIARACEPIKTAPKTRIKERNSCLWMLETAEKFTKLNVYDDDIRIKGTTNRIIEVYDSLYVDLISDFHNLTKYKHANKKDINQILDEEYDLNNY